MFQVLLVAIRLYDGRYHGSDDDPPSPGRLFQALIAGAGLSGPLKDNDLEALEWLECLGPPIIASPRLAGGQAFSNYFPNNDLDAKGGDYRRIGEIRSAKHVRPLLYDAAIPFVYAWTFEPTGGRRQQADRIVALADCLYQFGRGVDLAWAWGEVLESQQLMDEALESFPGPVYHPRPQGRRMLGCPTEGTMRSLTVRHGANAKRFETHAPAGKVQQNFSRRPKPRFVQVAYESAPTRLLFELRRAGDFDALAAWPLDEIQELTTTLRDAAAEKLRDISRYRGVVERVLIGRKADGADAGPAEERIRIIALPSIGHPLVERSIRRALVEVPSGCPIRADDVRWAFSGLEPASAEDEPLGFVLVASDDRGMLGHYGVGDPARGSRLWRSVTPLALPEEARRRRIDPSRRSEEPKGASERADEEGRAAAAVARALRHAGVRRKALAVGVQREPFEAKGRRADDFAYPPRFDKHRLWHVEVQFDGPVHGPLILGDGRYLGLGLMAPRPPQSSFAIRAFSTEADLVDDPQPERLSRALRRAVIARAQAIWGSRRELPAFFTGHAPDGRPARSEDEPHLGFVFDPAFRRLLVLSPHQLEHREPRRRERKWLETLDEALGGFTELRAGLDGLFSLRSLRVGGDQDPLFRPARSWLSMTPYRATRHAKAASATDALVADVQLECRRRDLPRPEVNVLEWRAESGRGLSGRVRLRFSVAVPGPIVLGRTRHLGGGLFAAEE